MGTYRTQTWQGNPAAPTAHERRIGAFEAYVPHDLVGWHPLLPADMAGFVAPAELDLSETASVLTPNAASTSMFFWAESLGSSRIEGVSPRPRRVVHTMIAEASPSPPHRHGAVGEAIGNIEATQEALRILEHPSALTVDDLRNAHRVLMRSSSAPFLGGALKTTQNWTGGNDWHPLDGDFVPPPPEQCLPLMEDLVVYLRTADHSLRRLGVFQDTFISAQAEWARDGDVPLLSLRLLSSLSTSFPGVSLRSRFTRSGFPVVLATPARADTSPTSHVVPKGKPAHGQDARSFSISEIASARSAILQRISLPPNHSLSATCTSRAGWK